MALLSRYARAIALVVAVAMQCCAHAQGEGLTAAVTFRWDYEAPGAAGFVLYCGTSTQWYTTRDDVGNADRATLALQEGVVYFCAVTAYDAGGIEGRFSNEFAVRVTDAATGAVSVEPPITIPQAADAVTLTATGYRVRFSRAFNVQSLDLQGMAGGKEPPGIALVGMSTGIVRGSIVSDLDNRAFTFVKTGDVLAPDTYSLTIRSGGGGLTDEFGRPIDGNGDGAFGDDFRLSFAVPARNDVIVGIQEFARGPGQPVRLPAGNPAAGIPVRIANAAGVTDVAFTLRYQPALLTLSGVRLGSTLSGDVTLASIDNAAGIAHIRVQNLQGLAAARTELLTLDAQVPMSAPYGATHVLDISELQINGGSIAGKDDDGLHVVAYFGDITGDGSYSSLDLSPLQLLVVGTDVKLAGYPLLDPRLIADISGNGTISSLDTSRLSQWIRSGLNSSVRPEFEPLPVTP